MIWQSFGEFVAMGGYALYVWGACGMVAVTLVAEVLMVERRLRLARHGASGESGAPGGDRTGAVR